MLQRLVSRMYLEGTRNVCHKAKTRDLTSVADGNGNDGIWPFDTNLLVGMMKIRALFSRMDLKMWRGQTVKKTGV